MQRMLNSKKVECIKSSIQRNLNGKKFESKECDEGESN